MHKPAILYAEDDQVTRENYALVLKQYFSKVHMAKDGEEALALYYSEKPDALMLDINMPIIDGLEVIEAVRKENSEIPIVVLSAHSDREKLLRAIPLGLTRYLVKPIKDDLFRTTIQELIAQVQHKDTISLADGFRWDLTHNELTYHYNPVNLSPKETLLISLLAASPGHYLSHDLLIAEIWYGEEIDASHTYKLTQLVYRLNTKITTQTSEKTPLIENSYALGYRLIT